MAASSAGGLERKTEVRRYLAAERLPGVTVVRDGQFPRRHRTQLLSAEKAAGLIKAEWDSPASVPESKLWKRCGRTRARQRPRPSNNGAAP